MNFNIKIDQGAGYVDITKWCLVEPRETEPVPYNYRNRDVTPIYSSFRFILSDEAGITPAKDDLILVDVDSVYVFMGYINKIEPDDWSALSEILAIHYLDKLDFEVLEFFNLPANLSSSSDPFEYTNYFMAGGTFVKVNVHYFIEQMATLIGATIDTSNVSSIQAFQFTFPEGGGDATPGLKTVYHSDFYFDLYNLLALNQPDAGYFLLYDDIDADYNGNKISYRKVLSIICSALNYTIHPTGNKSFVLKYNLGNPTIVDSTVYEGNITAKEIEFEDINANVKYAVNPISDYYYQGGQLVATALEYKDSGGKSGNYIDWIPSFRIFFYGYVDGVKSATMAPPEDYEIPVVIPPNVAPNTFLTGLGLTPATYTFAELIAAFPLVSLSYRKLLSKIKNVNQWDYVTNYLTTQKGVIKNFIDLRKETSEIVQETYE